MFLRSLRVKVGGLIGVRIDPLLIKVETDAIVRIHELFRRARCLLGRQTQIVDIISSARVRAAETLASTSHFSVTRA